MSTSSDGAAFNWPADCGPSQRFTVYTRGNIGEVYPEVVLPLEWDLAGPASEQGWRDGAASVGFATDADLGDEPFVMLGVFGGYAYFNVAVMRLLGVRTPGMAPSVIDTQLLGEADIDDYQRRAGDRSALATARLVATAARTLRAKQVPLLREMRQRVMAQRAKFPGIDAPDDRLWSYVKQSLDDLWAYLIASHVVNTMRATIASGALTDFCGRHLGDANLALELTTGIGDVVSAEPARAMWKLANETPPHEYATEFASFLSRYGHRGPNEFSLHGRDWASFPELATAAIETMRGLDASRSPMLQARRVADQRRQATETAHKALGRRAPRLDRVIASTALWSRSREESKDLVILGNQLGRHAVLELIRRAAERGGVADRTGPMLLTGDEFEAYIGDPQSMVATIETRRQTYDRLSRLDPPFAFDASAHGGTAPPVSTWSARPDASGPQVDAAAAPGSLLRGAGGAPGIVSGRARVVVDPGDPRGLQPGEILVAPLTDPSWTPLFVGAGAVVVEIGAAMSHSMIVSRELGIPCVVGVKGATQRIAEGSMIEVDGSSGTVRIL